MHDEILKEKLKTTFQKLGIADNEEKQNEIAIGLDCLANLIIDCFEARGK